VHHVFARTGKYALACLVILALIALASLGLGSSAGSLRSTTPSPAEIVASRFPSADTALTVRPVTFSTASVMPVEHWERFDQDALSGVATAEQPWPTAAAAPAAIETTAPPISEQQTGESAPVSEPVKPEPSKAQAAPARRGATGRSSNVLNDAQIASIKRRLKLSAEQEQMWPAVEAALRKIVYTKNAMSPQTHAVQSSGSPTAYIDPSSSEVRQLKTAALPLLMRLNDEQKREVKMLAYVMGLEAVASQF
jgi:acetylornithine deacetylase/succinyl-diaminopimelate desuccinylase-like protein